MDGWTEGMNQHVHCIQIKEKNGWCFPALWSRLTIGKIDQHHVQMNLNQGHACTAYIHRTVQYFGHTTYLGYIFLYGAST